MGVQLTCLFHIRFGTVFVSSKIIDDVVSIPNMNFVALGYSKELNQCTVDALSPPVASDSQGKRKITLR